ncbi:300 kDa antigen AG231-like isoform X1 [Salvelinus fontinalis]|uniref:300 kDa antigen AG231-like isoform X1 n=1 Tax=Salvelinus fontinalis TaxID=8038 RepID=UPI0024869EA9|nr:300 kDa antigen AG231-like isoform X1 [Salvelinus fontinalis]
MSVQLVVALLALASLNAASAPLCKELVKPLLLEDHTEIYGKWVYVMGSTDHSVFQKALGTLKSSWIDLSATSDQQVVTLRWGDRIDGKCVVGATNATISGTTSTVHIHLSEHKGQYLETCHDCLLWSDTSRNGDITGRYLLLFTRSGKMDATYLDTYKNQAECLNFPEKHHTYDGETELCPDDNEKMVDEDTMEEKPTTEEEKTIVEEATTEEKPTSEEEKTTEKNPTTEEEKTTEKNPTTEEEKTTEKNPTTEEEKTTEKNLTTEEEKTTEKNPTTEEEKTTEKNATTEEEKTMD